jgi:hypothetical protein
MRSRAVDWLWISGDVCDHVWVMHGIHSRLVAGVESAVPLLEKRKEARCSAVVRSCLLHRINKGTKDT